MFQVYCTRPSIWEKKKYIRVVEFPILNSGVMSSPSTETHICDPNGVLKGTRRRERGKRRCTVVFLAA